MALRMKRFYDRPVQTDGLRVLVDRLWPRGITRDRASIDEWSKEIAPSDQLRKWFLRNPDNWDEFKRRYYRELDERLLEVDELAKMASRGHVTLLYSSRDGEHNNAAALLEYLQKEYYL